MGLEWAALVGSTWYIYGLSGHGFGVGSPGGFRMGYSWAKWACYKTGQPYLGTAWVLCELSGLV